MISIGYPGRRFIAYPIANAHTARGLSLINWNAEIQLDPATPFRREDWNRRGTSQNSCRGSRSGFSTGSTCRRSCAHRRAIYEYPCVDRDPIERWTHGRVTLLGDAAHPMYPMGSNGASQAILDARALAEALVSEPDIDRALAAYEAARRPATAQVVLANRRQGPAEIQTIVEERAPNGFDDIEFVISAAELAEISRNTSDWRGSTRTP